MVSFDRWDNRYLLVGVHPMYISEHIKESLRAIQGKSIFVDAKRVYQAMNPRDGLIQQLVVQGV